MKRHGLCLLLALFMGVANLAFAQSPVDTTITGHRYQCISGSAAGFPCSNIDLLSKISVHDLQQATIPVEDHVTDLADIWGWTDPDTGDEYALVGMENGVAFVNVTDPVNPVLTGTLRSHNPGTRSLWRDMKVYLDHMFVVVDGSSDNGVQIFDLTQLRGVADPRPFAESAYYDGVSTAHNIAINEETGFAYVVGSRGGTNGPNCGVGLHIIDIKDPLNPTYAGCFNDPASGNSNNGYTHDVQCVIYNGPDERYQGREICLGSNVTRLSIADVTDKENPTLIASVSYPGVGYAHQGWLTEDQEYFLMNDEFDESQGLTSTRTIIWDIDKLDDPIFMQPFENPVGSTDHNLYIRNGYAYQANYRSGLRIIDIEDVYAHAPREIGFFDTVPGSDSPGFWGAWSAYPFFSSNTIIVSSISEGLFVLQATNQRSRVSTEEEAEVPESFHLSSVYPNPFNPNALVTLSLAEAQAVRIAAYDLTGREVALLHEGRLPVGAHDFRFEAGHLPSGVYAIKAIGAGATQVSMATLAK